MLPRAFEECLRPRRAWRAVLTGCLSGYLAACASFVPKYERPVLTVAQVQLQGGNILRQNFLVKLHVQNPNKRELPVTGVHAELRVEGEAVASGVTNHAFVVPAFGETDFDMTITANMALVLLKIAGQRDQRQDTIGYEVTGAADVDLPFLRGLPFHQSGVYSLKGLQ